MIFCETQKECVQMVFGIGALHQKNEVLTLVKQ